MNCPRCVTAPMTERDRSGVQIDICTRCRGIWLDRGELDKLLAHATSTLDDDDDDDDDDDGDRRSGRRGRSDRPWWAIFD